MTAGSESDHVGPEELSSRAVAGVGPMSTIGFSRFLSMPTPVCGPQDLRLVPETSDPEGLVGAIGAGMEDTALLTTLVRETDVEVLMLPGRYTPARPVRAGRGYCQPARSVGFR